MLSLLLSPQVQPEVHILITVLLQLFPATPKELNSLCHRVRNRGALCQLYRQALKSEIQ